MRTTPTKRESEKEREIGGKRQQLERLGIQNVWSHQAYALLSHSLGLSKIKRSNKLWSCQCVQAKGLCPYTCTHTHVCVCLNIPLYMQISWISFRPQKRVSDQDWRLLPDTLSGGRPGDPWTWVNCGWIRFDERRIDLPPTGSAA